MNSENDLLTRVRRAVGPRVDVSLDGGDIRLAGEFARLAEKKLALERAAAVPGVSAIIDHLRVAPVVVREDSEILEGVRGALLGEALLGQCAVHPNGHGDRLRATSLFPEGSHGLIDVTVQDGVVTLDGEVGDLAKKQLAGFLAWRVPGCRDVINGLEVTGPRRPGGDIPLDAIVMLALAHEPALDARGIAIKAEGSTIILEGHAASEAEARLAENDAWTVFGVDRVRNKLVVPAS